MGLWPVPSPVEQAYPEVLQGLSDGPREHAQGPLSLLPLGAGHSGT
jgi:hypothetical protein